MDVFSTREIAIFIYAIVLLVYVLIHKKGRAAIGAVIKAACHIKLIIPFIIVLLFAATIVWGCTYLPFWDWIYIKDIVLWTVFAGVPVCFNATSRQIDDHYFRNIVVDNLKFAALVEFITGTFTFHIVVEIILQPILVLFVVLQVTAERKEHSVKKFVDRIVGVTGLLIIALTIKSAIEAFNDIKIIDITVSFVLPIVLSVLYLPVAYFFAVYAKYELLFLRMSFKEPKSRRIKVKHRLKTILACRLSYKRLQIFLYEYMPRMYTSMDNLEFDQLLNDFKTDIKYSKANANKD